MSLAILQTTVPISPTPELPHYDYSLYGLRVRTCLKLTLHDIPLEATADVEVFPGDPKFFEEMSAPLTLPQGDWIHRHELSNGWSYLRYDDLFEFLVSPAGDRILYQFLAEVPLESFQTYALGRVFSFALVKKGYEPLHAATVVVNGKAVGFLGASTFGKSSLAACFVAAGYPLLTDDTLRLEERAGKYVAFPGPPRLRLLPKVGRLYLGNNTDAVIMNPTEKNSKAPKLVYCLTSSQSFSAVVPLGAIYVVTAPRKVYRKQQVVIGAMTPLQALMSMLSFTHNDELSGASRLSRQLDAAQSLISAVTIRSLAYPRVLASLHEVKNAVLEDLKNYVDSI